MIEALRTPEERFAECPDFDWPVRYVEGLPGFDGVRGAYVDAGPVEAERVFLCLHGEPSWSFLYRRMIPVFLEGGGRVVAPDLIGFGRSDKPVREEDYGFSRHRAYLLGLVERLDLRNITLVVQDWGGLLGLTLPVDPGFAARLERLIVMNTALATGEGSPSAGFEAWKAYALATHDLPVARIVAQGTPHLTKAEIAAYDAPFPDATYKAGARVFPALVPVRPDMDGVAVSREAKTWWATAWSGPSFMAVGDADPVLGLDAMRALRRVIRGCPEPMMIEGGGHFVQEWGEPIARAALAHFAAAEPSGDA